MAVRQPTYHPQHYHHPPPTTFLSSYPPAVLPHTPELTPPKMELALHKPGGPMGGPMAAPSGGLASYAGELSTLHRTCHCLQTSSNGCMALVRQSLSFLVHSSGFPYSLITTDLPSESSSNTPFASVRSLCLSDLANHSRLSFGHYRRIALHLQTQAQAPQYPRSTWKRVQTVREQFGVE
jgi:hypothetical protein